MVSEDEAHRAAERLLTETYGDDAVGSTIVIEGVGEVSIAWIVAFDSVDDDPDAPIPPGQTRNIVVPKNGAPAHMPPSAFPLRKYLSMVESGEFDWPVR